jgi:integrase
MSIRIKPRKTGFIVDIWYRLPTGERARDRRYLADLSKSAAQRWASERLKHLVVHGKETATPAAPEIPTLADFKSRYIEKHVEANRLKKGTVDAIESHFKNHLLPQLGTKRLNQISNEDVQSLKGSMKHLAPKTVNNVLSDLSRTLNAAVEWDVIPRMPCKITLMKVPPSEMNWYEEADLEQLLAGARKSGVDVELIVLLGADAGLREGEMVALESSDIRRGVLTVSRAEYLGVTQSPKSNKERKIELTARLADCLQRARHLRGPRVFYQEDGKTQATAKWIIKRMKAAQRLAGMPVDGLVHVLRHTFGARLAAAGVPALAIQKLMGHASIATTQKYMHLSPTGGGAAIRLLEASGNKVASSGNAEGPAPTGPSRTAS